MSLHKLTRVDLPIGIPIDWAVYDEFDRLLLKPGAIVSSSRQADSLLMRGAYRIIEDSKPNKSGKTTKPSNRFPDGKTPFQLLREACTELRELFIELDTGNAKAVTAKTQGIARKIDKAYILSPDALLGAVHLLHEYEYSIAHPLHVAILAELLAISMEMKEKAAISLICACLTQNAAINELQETLQKQAEPLSTEQRKQIRTHPMDSVRLLARAGVRDQDWLNVVLQHHERVDGTGYPKKMKQDEISDGAKMIAIADRYAAMISSRAYREPMSPKDVLKEMFLTKGKESDEAISLLFIKEIGVYPPGTFVLLANGETGVVISKGKTILTPIVSAYIGHDGKAYANPLKRDSSDKTYGIKGQTIPDPSIGVNLDKLWFFT